MDTGLHRQSVPLLLLEDQPGTVLMQLLEIQRHTLFGSLFHKYFLRSGDRPADAHSRDLTGILQSGRLCCLRPALYTDSLSVKQHSIHVKYYGNYFHLSVLSRINSSMASCVGIAGIPPRFCTHSPATALPVMAHLHISSPVSSVISFSSPR